MIDEKMIEKYAEDYAYHNCSEEENYAAYKAFIAGINWFLGNLWHNASKEPKEGKQLVLRFPNGNCYACYKSGKYYKTPNISEDKYDVINTIDITRWLYIDDLLK